MRVWEKERTVKISEIEFPGEIRYERLLLNFDLPVVSLSRERTWIAPERWDSWLSSTRLGLGSSIRPARLMYWHFWMYNVKKRWLAVLVHSFCYSVRWAGPTSIIMIHNNHFSTPFGFEQKHSTLYSLCCWYCGGVNNSRLPFPYI